MCAEGLTNAVARAQGKNAESFLAYLKLCSAEKPFDHFSLFSQSLGSAVRFFSTAPAPRVCFRRRKNNYSNFCSNI
jgi:hypothetical protein